MSHAAMNFAQMLSAASTAPVQHKSVRQTNALLDAVMDRNEIKTDVALSRFLNIDAPTICKLRHGDYSITSHHILRIHEKTGMAVADIKTLAGVA
jgi:plasmid maintenance system antidote protein VapI